MTTDDLTDDESEGRELARRLFGHPAAADDPDDSATADRRTARALFSDNPPRTTDRED